MFCDLERLYGEIVTQLPTVTDGRKEFVVSWETLAAPPEKLATDQIIVVKTEHHYGSFRNDLLYFKAHKATFRQLGILILATIFQPEPLTVRLELLHPVSQVREFRIENNFRELKKLTGGFHTQPKAFVYWPEQPTDKARYLQSFCHHCTWNLPEFALTNQRQCLLTESDWQNRDVVLGCGTDEGSANFAELLLNFGLPDTEQTELVLEGAGGNRRVSETSAEVTLILPGHTFWIDEEWQR